MSGNLRLLVFLVSKFKSSLLCLTFPLVVGKLQAYDQHLNMILGDVEETVTTVEIDEETYEELYKVKQHAYTGKDISNSRYS